MYQKMKLTNLRQFETSKEEMNYLKGGNESPEQAPPWVCYPFCQCDSYCIGSQNADNVYKNTRDSSRNGGVGSNVVHTLLW